MDCDKLRGMSELPKCCPHCHARGPLQPVKFGSERFLVCCAVASKVILLGLGYVEIDCAAEVRQSGLFPVAPATECQRVPRAASDRGGRL